MKKPFVCLLVIFLAGVMCAAQSHEVIISRAGDVATRLRLVEQEGKVPHHLAVLVSTHSPSGAADSVVVPIKEISGLGLWIEVAGRTPDSSGVVLGLTSATERLAIDSPRVRHVVIRSQTFGGYNLVDVDGRIMESLRDVFQGARMVHKGETTRPLTGLKPIDLKLEPHSRTLSRHAFAGAGIDRLEPMWLLSDEAKGAQCILTYGYDDDGHATVQVVRSWYGPLRRLIYQRGAIVGVTPSGGDSPTLRVFDESSDSSRYARVIRYAWADPDADTMADGRYVVQAMTIVSACVIPPRRWDAFPQPARIVRSVRLGFAAGYEGCSSARHGDASWPFGKPLDAATSCEILATAKDANDNTWHFVGVRLPNDPALRRLFGDFASSESEQLITGGWIAASAVDASAP